MQPPIPPADRTCPICLENVTLAIQTNCGHSFCGNCFFNYYELRDAGRGVLERAVNCPCCRRRVDLLHPDWSGDAGGLPARVRQYNRLFSDEPRSWRNALLDAPVLLTRFWNQLSRGPANVVPVLCSLRVAAFFIVSILYILSPLDIIPEAVFGAFGLVDDVLVLGIFLLYLASAYRRSVLAR